MTSKPIAHVTPFTLFSINKERWDEVAREVLYLLSMVFSNTVGLVETAGESSISEKTSCSIFTTY